MSSEMSNMDPEGIDGVRMSWNVWPRTKVEASKCVIPLAACIAPLRPHPDIPTLPYAPLRCKTCSAVLNPFSRVDFTAKIWICPFCYQRNHFPPHYAAISDTNLPGELYPQYTTIQYSLPSMNPSNPGDPQAHASPVFIFVLDTCMIEEELGFAKSALKQAIGLLPDNALVGFVSFGTQVHSFHTRPSMHDSNDRSLIHQQRSRQDMLATPCSGTRAGTHHTRGFVPSPLTPSLSRFALSCDSFSGTNNRSEEEKRGAWDCR